MLAALGMGVAPQPIIERSTASVQALTAGFRNRLAEARANPEAPARLAGSRSASGAAGNRAGQDSEAFLMTVDFDQITALAPLLLISGAGCLALLLDTMTRGREPALRLAQLGCLAALAAVAGQCVRR